MSGGSYNYACYCDPWTVCEEDLENMANDMKSEGYEKASEIIRDYLDEIKTHKSTLITLHENNEKLMKSWEWYRSCDTCKEDFEKDIEEMGLL